MKDQLETHIENFIAQNRGEMDRFDPPEGIWDKIAQELDQQEEEDQLEAFIEVNQDALQDQFEVPTMLWNKIDQELNEPLKLDQESQVEQFIQSHRSDLDLFEVPGHIWKRIEEKIWGSKLQADGKKEEKFIRISYRQIRNMAAAVILLITVYGLFKLNPGKQANELANNQNSEINLSSINPELAEVEVYYTRMIAVKKEEIEQYKAQQESLDPDFFNDIEQLDLLYLKLKEELYEIPGKEEIMDAMIQNLQTRIQILNKQLEILKRIQDLQNGSKNEEIIL